MANQENTDFDMGDLDTWQQEETPGKAKRVECLEKSLSRGSQGQRDAKARALLKLQRSGWWLTSIRAGVR